MDISSEDVRSRELLAEDSAEGPLFSTSGFFVLRTPLLPFEDFLSWGQSVQASKVFERTRDPHATEAAWLDDVELLRRRLREITDQPEIRQALFIASPSLEASSMAGVLRPIAREGFRQKGL